jgi:site-specific DNA-methyltransferase (adenine-specific)
LIIKVAFDFDLGIPIIPDDIKERVRQGEQIDIEILPQTSGFANNALKHGVAGLWVDGGRVPTNGRPKREVHPLRDDVDYHPNSLQGRVDGSLASSKAIGETLQGRWPANLIHDGSDEVVGLFPVTSSGGSGKPKGDGTAFFGTANRGVNNEISRNQGSAARFFYCAKASRSERGEGNNHPTVKPLALMRYLCRLTKTPTGGRVLDMFAGSGTTLLAAMQEGRETVGIEIDEETCKIVVRRIEQQMPIQLELETCSAD